MSQIHIMVTEYLSLGLIAIDEIYLHSIITETVRKDLAQKARKKQKYKYLKINAYYFLIHSYF